MPVISLSDRIEGYVAAYLEAEAPDCVEVIFTTTIQPKIEECEHEHLTFETVLWLTVWVNPLDQGTESTSVSGFIPVSLVLDGDMVPVGLLVSEVWDRVWGSFQFHTITDGVERELAATPDEG